MLHKALAEPEGDGPQRHGYRTLCVRPSWHHCPGTHLQAAPHPGAGWLGAPGRGGWPHHAGARPEGTGGGHPLCHPRLPQWLSLDDACAVLGPPAPEGLLCRHRVPEEVLGPHPLAHGRLGGWEADLQGATE
eukprot:4971748-Lingulodinium_polyedra.AAC.1